ncbi:hypothetical protein V2H77_11655 [Photorhabdus sp. P32]|uniref:hypothetical protein n=1 Tax=Photorhabdus sp. P32 TaxID=3117549 RepID=UPI00311B097D
MANENRQILTLRGLIERQPSIAVKSKKDNAKSRRLAKQMAFWDKKRAEHEAKPKSRSVNEIDVLANLIITLKSNDKPEFSGSRCLHNTWLYSVR